MSKPTNVQRAVTVADFVQVMEDIAPIALAQDWDNVGLIAGDEGSRVQRVMLAIDLMPAVIDEAIRSKTDLLFCYHPPILGPIRTLTTAGNGTEPLVFDCVRNNIALYAGHTALDAAEGGTNDVIASLCGIAATQPLEYVDAPGEDNCKLVVFAPPSSADGVADAAFAAGAGIIGGYTHCSFRGEGTGTFFGTEGTSPAVGERGRLERVSEVRIEMVVGRVKLPAVVAAVRSAHPYEEPAFDLYPLTPPPRRGIGRIGKLPDPTTVGLLANQLAQVTGAQCPMIIGRSGDAVTRAIIVVGAAGSLPLRAGVGRGDVVVTGEIRHHDALVLHRAGASAIALGHWASERPVLGPLARMLRVRLRTVDVRISRADRDPLRSLPAASGS